MKFAVLQNVHNGSESSLLRVSMEQKDEVKNWTWSAGEVLVNAVSQDKFILFAFNYLCFS